MRTTAATLSKAQPTATPDRISAQVHTTPTAAPTASASAAARKSRSAPTMTCPRLPLSNMNTTRPGPSPMRDQALRHPGRPADVRATPGAPRATMATATATTAAAAGWWANGASTVMKLTRTVRSTASARLRPRRADDPSDGSNARNHPRATVPTTPAPKSIQGSAEICPIAAPAASRRSDQSRAAFTPTARAIGQARMAAANPPSTTIASTSRLEVSPISQTVCVVKTRIAWNPSRRAAVTTSTSVPIARRTASPTERACVTAIVVLERW